MSDGYERGDVDRAVALVSADRSPQARIERLGIDWEYLSRLASGGGGAGLDTQQP